MSISHHFLRIGCVAAGITLAALSLASCDLAKNQLTYDRGTNQDMQDFRDGLSPDHHPASATSAPLPDFQSVVATPKDLKLPSPLVTVSVNETVSLHDLMFELADKAGVDLEMDPNIHGSIIFTAKDRPFSDVVDRICEMAGLRYTFENNVLRIELDKPYVKDYKVDYMSTLRKNNTDITTGISSTTSGGTAGATSSKNGSDATVSNTNNNDVWADLDAGLKQLLSASDQYISLASEGDPVAIAEPPSPLPLGPDGQPLPGASNLPPSLSVSNAVSKSSGPPAAVVHASYSISKGTGVVSVFATERQHKLVQKFFENYRRQALTQVLIEAKVLEVDLNDQFASGIEWGSMASTGVLNPTSVVFPSQGFSPTDATGSIFRAALKTDIDGSAFKAVVQALSQFGTVRALSSPRVTVMNNQSAVVNVAENLIYFTVQAQVTPSTTTANATVSFNSTIQSVPEGVLLNVTPTINPDTGEIILALRPTISKQAGPPVQDPGLYLNIAEANATAPAGSTPITVPSDPIPVMNVQEIDSIIKMQSGQTMVMGGLMKDGNTVSQEGIPVLGDIPLLGSLFRSHSDNIQKQELVIFIKASIVPGSNMQDMDRKVYKQFGNDTRPFAM